MEPGFAFLDEVLPGIRWDAKYATSDNFTGKPVDGYGVNRIVVSDPVAAGLAPHQTAMFDDIAQNLVAAGEMGMTTVWLNTGLDFSSGGPQAIEAPHHQTRNLPEFLHAIRI